MENGKKITVYIIFILPVAGRNEKKKCILMFLGIFPIACVRKKNIYINMFFWGIFQQLKRKKNMLKKCSRNGFGLLPNCIVKKKIELQP